MSKIKKIGIILIFAFMVLVILPISAISIYQYDLKINNPEEYAKLEAEWAVDKEKKRQEQLTRDELKRQEAIRESEERVEEKAKEEFGLGATTESGRLKYRPHWLVMDEWVEKERSGLIEKSQGCADIVTIISRTSYDLDTQKFWYNSWLEECVRG